MSTPTPWTPINDYDNFDPDPAPPNPWGYIPPSYEVNGYWGPVTGIPDDNPAVPVVKLCRVLAAGSSDGTVQIRTQDGWLLDNVELHTGAQIGNFIYVMFIGAWCLDLSFDVWLPATPVVPDDYVYPPAAEGT